MAKINTLSKRQIKIGTKKVAKVEQLKIVESKSSILIEVIPKYYSDLTAKDLNELYLSILKLGRNLYQENKKKNNISKIKFNEFDTTIYDNKYLLRNHNLKEDKYTIDYIKKYIKNWDKKNNIWNTSEFSNYFFLKSDQNLDIKTVTKWIKNNFVPIETDVPEHDCWMYVNYQKIIDLSIFIYLITYSIRNSINPSVKKNIDDIQFKDFIEDSSKTLENTIEDYLPLINNIIHMYELHNMRYLYGYNRLKYNYDENKFDVGIEYDDIFGVIWYIFKLYLANSALDKEGNTIPISICEECGNPFLGKNLRCLDCDCDNPRIRKIKSRKELLNHLNKIDNIVKNYKLSKNLLDEANKFLTMPKSRLYNNKRNVDSLLNKLNNYIKKES